MLISLRESAKKLRERSKAEKRKIEATIEKTKLEDIMSVLSCKCDMGPKLCTILMTKAVNQHFVHIWEDDDTPVSWNGRVVSYQMKSAEYDVSLQMEMRWMMEKNTVLKCINLLQIWW